MITTNCNENRFVREKDSFQVDLRVHGVSQDATYKDEERMTPIQILVDKQQDRYRTHSIINDLEKKGTSSTFSEASRRTIKEMGSIEFFELGETVRTIQCSPCLKYCKEGTVYCSCGLCLMPSPEQTEKIKNRIGITSNPLYIMKEKVHQENVMDQHSGSTMIGKRKTQQQE